MARRKQPSKARAVATNASRPTRQPAQFTEHIPVRFDVQLVEDVNVFALDRQWTFNQAIRVLVRKGLTAANEAIPELLAPKPTEFTPREIVRCKRCDRLSLDCECPPLAIVEGA